MNRKLIALFVICTMIITGISCKRIGITLVADLYDNLAVIPFDRMEAFFQKNLK